MNFQQIKSLIIFSNRIHSNPNKKKYMQNKYWKLSNILKGKYILKFNATLIIVLSIIVLVVEDIKIDEMK